MSLPEALTLSLFHQIDQQLSLVISPGWQEQYEFGKTDLKFAQWVTMIDNRNLDGTWNIALGVYYQLSEPWKLMAGLLAILLQVNKKDRTIDISTDSLCIGYTLSGEFNDNYIHIVNINASWKF